MGILTFRHCDVKVTPYMKFFWIWSQDLEIALYAEFEPDQVIMLKII